MRQLFKTPLRRLILAAILAVASSLLALDGSRLVAGAWQGKIVDKDGIPHVMNPAEPAAAVRTIELQPRWEAGGDDEDYLFGVLSQITTDAEGNVYLLDSQLNEVQVFSSTGEYLRTIGREGEGPGEFRRPSDLFMTPEGNVGVLQAMPGKVVMMTKEGEPIGNHPLPDDDGMRMFNRGCLAGDKLVLNQMQFARKEDGMEMKSALIAIDADGKQTATYLENTRKRDFAKMVFDEKTMQGALVWSAAPDGHVYTSDNFDAYTIKVWTSDGKVERVIERTCEPRVRSEEERERNKPRIMIRRGNQTQQPEVIASETDRDVQAIYPRGDGSLWVLSSHGAFDAPSGTIATFDVFDPEGRFMNQIALKGHGNFADDGFYVVDNHFFVVTGLRSAQRSQFGGDDEEVNEDAEPMRVICYDLGATIAKKD